MSRDGDLQTKIAVATHVAPTTAQGVVAAEAAPTGRCRARLMGKVRADGVEYAGRSHGRMDRRRRMRWLTLLALWILIAASAAAAAPRIAEIRITGNRVTQEKVILREMDLHAGDPAEPEAIERNRQAILDLGLFREVHLVQQPAADGAVALEVRVREKRYLLPVPRVDTSSDEDFSYGAQLRWSNVFGLNHRLNAVYEEGRYPSERTRERDRSARLTYFAPYIADSRYDLRARVEHREQVTSIDGGDFDETFRRVEALVARDYTRGRPRTGWTVGGGLLWEDQTTAGALAPPPDGHATALVGTADYEDLRFHVYSETGRRFNARVEAAADGLASDYGYTRLTAGYFESRRFGAREHQTLHFLAGGGVVTGGPRSRNNFTLGGSGDLRGYESDFIEGDHYYYGAVEYLRPLRWDWLRLLVLAEVGGTSRDIRGGADGSPYASIGLGVRIRLTWFVDVEIEAGVAQPLRGGDGARFFAGGN